MKESLIKQTIDILEEIENISFLPFYIFKFLKDFFVENKCQDRYIFKIAIYIKKFI